MAKITAISPDLRATLEESESIEIVHFTAKGDHYFNVHEYVNEKGKKSGKFYGYLLSKVVEVVSTDARGNTKATLKLVSVPNPKTEIVCTLTREQALALPDLEVEESAAVNPALANQKKTGRKAVKAQVAENE